jgi:HAD superfamily hydrolase (TIGR01484 family)
MNTQAKHLFFDVDNTITRSKSPITPEHETIFLDVAKTHDMIVVSGSKQQDIWGRFTDASAGSYYTLAQNGNYAFDKERNELWKRLLTDTQKQAIFAFIEKVRAHTHPPVSDENDLLEDRGCQVAYSFIGHHEKIEIKEKFDPTFEVRKKVLADLAADVQKLSDEYNIEISIGGTTNLDIYEKGKNKGFNTKALCEMKGWKIEDCLYFGDALFPGGNDYTVVGILPTQHVKDYKETYELLKTLH